MMDYAKVSNDPMLLAFAVIGILAMVELCRRSVGLPILCVAGALILYTLFGANIRIGKALFDMFYTTNGIIGTPVSACQKFIVMFIIFGAFLERTGISISLSAWPTVWPAPPPAARPRWPSSPPPCAAWCLAPPWATPSPPARSPSP